MDANDVMVDVRDLVVHFGAITAVDHVDLAIEPATIYGLLGPNGAGKTTLIRVLATLLRPESGSVRVAGIDVLAEPTRARAHLGLAGQFAAVDAYQTGRENVRMVGRLYGLSAAEARRRTDTVLEQINLIEAADRRVGTYSGGMRRRLDLAASLVGRPDVMFLDEPSTGVDPRARQELWEIVQQLVDGGTTVLLTTQYLEEADRLASRIGVIDQGRIISEGTPDELKDRLGTAVLEIGVEPDDRERAIALLDAMSDGGAVWDAERARIRIPAHEGWRTTATATRTLDDAGIEPTDVAVHRPTLDDVFLELTGQLTETAPAEPAAEQPRRRGIKARR
ncbi:MAG: ATP-binding cassette domain-containing protein [Nitriliruptoraceae bacterium]